MKTLIGSFLLLLNLVATGQKNGLRYSGSVQAGLLEGEDGSAFQLQTVQGMAYKTWKAGLGTGLDYYFVRSLPLFLNVQKTFGAAKASPFVYGDGGYHFPWLTSTQKLDNNGKTTGGLYYDAGLGYSLPVKRSFLSFSAGFSFKAYRFTNEYTICPFVGPCYTQTNVSDYSLRRLSLKTGLSF